MTTTFSGLSKQVVFHGRENKHDFVKNVPGNWWNLYDFGKTSLVSLYRFHCTCIMCMLFNSLWPSVNIWQHRSGSTLAQVMASCHMTPSHYLNQCLLVTKGVLWHSPKSTFTRVAHELITWGRRLPVLLPNLPGAYVFKVKPWIDKWITVMINW